MPVSVYSFLCIAGAEADRPLARSIPDLYLPPRLEEGQQPQTILPFIEGPQPPTEGGVFRIPSLPSWGSSSTSSRSTRANSVSSEMQEGDIESQTENKDKDHDHNTPKLSVWFSLALLVVVTVLTGGELLSCAELEVVPERGERVEQS